VANAKHDANEILESDDQLIFVLHDLPGQLLGNILAMSSSPNFIFDPLVMQLEKLYYISAIAGNGQGAGNVNLTDPCLSVSSGTPIVFHALPTITATTGDTVCSGNDGIILLQITGNPSFNIQISSTSGTYPALVGSSFVAPFYDNPTSNTLYSFIISDQFCSNNNPVTESIYVHSSLTINGLKHVCDQNKANYVVEFNITGGMAGSYKVTGGSGLLSGSVFLSDPIPVGEAYQFLVDDKYGCGPYVVAGSYNCQCESDPGTISTSSNFYCTNEVIDIKLAGSFKDADDVLAYVLSSSQVFDPNNIIWYSETPVLSFDVLKMLPNVKYYLFTVVGNPSGNPQIPSTADQCFKQGNVVEISFKETPKISIKIPESLTCILKEVVIDGSKSSIGFTQWSNSVGNKILNSNSLNPVVTQSGWYVLKIIEPIAGCSNVDSVFVNKNPEIVDATIKIKDPACGKKDGELNVVDIKGGTPPYSFESDLKVSKTGLFTNLSSGTYIVIITDAIGCEFSKSATLNSGTPINLELGPDITVNYGETITLNSQINIDSNLLTTIKWKNLPDDACSYCLNPSFTGKYSNKLYLQVSSKDCEAVDNINIYVVKQRDIYIPSAFSPNGDGYNDQFVIFGGQYVERVLQFAVYNRWGEQLFEAGDFVPDGKLHGWDGMHRNQLMNTGVYVYYALVKFNDGELVIYSGDVNLMR
jgi:gliding motility-associated-like protein